MPANLTEVVPHLTLLWMRYLGNIIFSQNSFIFLFHDNYIFLILKSCHNMIRFSYRGNCFCVKWISCCGPTSRFSSKTIVLQCLGIHKDFNWIFYVFWVPVINCSAWISSLNSKLHSCKLSPHCWYLCMRWGVLYNILLPINWYSGSIDKNMKAKTMNKIRISHGYFIRSYSHCIIP